MIDGAVAFITPGPLTGLDAALARPHRIIRANAPQRRDGNFRLNDRILPPATVVRRAAARGRRVFVVVPEPESAPSAATWDRLFAGLPDGPRRVRTRVLPGFIPLAVHTYQRPR